MKKKNYDLLSPIMYWFCFYIICLLLIGSLISLFAFYSYHVWLTTCHSITTCHSMTLSTGRSFQWLFGRMMSITKGKFINSHKNTFKVYQTFYSVISTFCCIYSQFRFPLHATMCFNSIIFSVVFSEKQLLVKTTNQNHASKNTFFLPKFISLL